MGKIRGNSFRATAGIALQKELKVTSSPLADGLYFSNSYAEGRKRFLTACDRAGLTPHSYAHPGLTGPSGEELAMDIAWIGPRNAGNVLLASCGTHGLEAAAGAATMIRWLETIAADRQLPDGVAVFLIHAVNPFGWAYHRRGNEDGIDLNRNFIDHSVPLPGNNAYRELHPFVAVTSPDQESLDEFSRRFREFCETNSMSQGLNGITSGQYEFPGGLSFGGQSASWSRRTLEEIARTHLVSAEKILHIDWHTGIGEFSKPFFILDDTHTSEAFRLASGWWPSHTIHCDDVVDDASIKYHGLLTEGLRKELAQYSSAQIVSLTIEWGTYEVEKMLAALLIDNWLIHRRSNTPTYLVENAVERLRELFCPTDATWRQSVVARSEAIYEDALSALATW